MKRQFSLRVKSKGLWQNVLCCERAPLNEFSNVVRTRLVTLEMKAVIVSPYLCKNKDSKGPLALLKFKEIDNEQCCEQIKVPGSLSFALKCTKIDG